MQNTQTTKIKNKNSGMGKGFAEAYLKKQLNFYPKITMPVENDTGFIIVIPCFNEPDIFPTLTSLHNCTLPATSVELIIVINSPDGVANDILLQNRKTCDDIENWKLKHQSSSFRVHCIFEDDLPQKIAGAGLARKIGMDEAIFRYNSITKPQGIICSFDADTTCDKNYFLEIESLLWKFPATGGAAIYFEHPVIGTEFEEEVYLAVSLYELHMRYYIQALRYTGFPYAYHSLGSAFFVTAETYTRFGGMNRKKAGEDFYFLQKVIPNIEFCDLLTTAVYPSSRVSNRVPFGTGPWINKFLEQGSGVFKTYNYDAFIDLKYIFSKIEYLFACTSGDIPVFYKTLPPSIRSFISLNKFQSKIHEIGSNTSTVKAFSKRFYNWFNGLQVVKFLNYSHNEFFQKLDVTSQAQDFLNEITKEDIIYSGPGELLFAYRELEKGNI